MRLAKIWLIEYIDKSNVSCIYFIFLPFIVGRKILVFVVISINMAKQALLKVSSVILNLIRHLLGSSVLAWIIPWSEETGGLQYMGLDMVRHDWENELKIVYPKKLHQRKYSIATRKLRY